MCGDLVAERNDANTLVLTPVWQPEEEWQGAESVHGPLPRRIAGRSYTVTLR